MAEELFITNNLTNRKEPFRPIEPNKVKMYACGVTVYDDCHVGHGMQAVFFDIIRRYLEYSGYAVTYVRNYTDVDDKIIARAKERGMGPDALAQSMIDSSETDMARLKVRPPDEAPRVSEMIPQIIAMIEAIIANGAGYATPSGDVYYRVNQKKDYGKLSNSRPDQMRSGTRDINVGEKEDELDFALWKKDETPGASWDSPWGRGRPGWHIECSAMSKEILGSHFDIHGGGRDLIFPHHENEIAQSESANGCDYANYWLHCGLLTINKQKMSKSLGNHITLRDFLDQWPAEVLKMAILQHHYTSNIDFSEAVFLNCHRRLLYYYRTLLELDQLAEKAQGTEPLIDGLDPNAVHAAFRKAMNDDFNTADAIGALNQYFKTANEIIAMKKSIAKHNSAKALATALRETFHVLSLLEEDPAAAVQDLKRRMLPKLGIDESWIQTKIQERSDARKAKDFAKADAVRDELAAKNIEMMDTPQGTDWSIRYVED